MISRRLRTRLGWVYLLRHPLKLFHGHFYVRGSSTTNRKSGEGPVQQVAHPRWRRGTLWLIKEESCPFRRSFLGIVLWPISNGDLTKIRKGHLQLGVSGRQTGPSEACRAEIPACGPGC